MKRAVCVLLKNEEGKFLSVTRKDNPNDFGMPGGKVEENESLEDAIVRETREETGLEINDLQKVYEGYDDHDYMVTCYAAKWFGKLIINNPDEETGVVAWVDRNILIEKSSFSGYNLTIFNELDFLKKVKTFEMGCHSIGIQVDFKTAETLCRIYRLTEEKAGKTSIDDLTEIDYFIKNKYQ